MVVVSVTSSSDDEEEPESNTFERRIRFACGDSNMAETGIVFLISGS